MHGEQAAGVAAKTGQDKRAQLRPRGRASIARGTSCKGGLSDI